MAYSVDVRTVPSQPVMEIHLETTLDAIGTAISDALGEVFGELQAEHGVPAGPPFVRYDHTGFSSVVVAIGVPVLTPVPAHGRVHAGALPGGEVAHTTHVGPYGSLGDAHAALEDWILAHGRTHADGMWEVYLSDPSTPADRCRTELFAPLS